MFYTENQISSIKNYSNETYKMLCSIGWNKDELGIFESAIRSDYAYYDMGDPKTVIAFEDAKTARFLSYSEGEEDAAYIARQLPSYEDRSIYAICKYAMAIFEYAIHVVAPQI